MAEYIDIDKLQKEFEEVCVGECDCCAREEGCPVYTQSTVTAIPIDKVKQARDEIQKIVDMCDNDSLSDLNRKNGKYRRISLLHSGLRLALEKIDKLITESEE